MRVENTNKNVSLGVGEGSRGCNLDRLGDVMGEGGVSAFLSFHLHRYFLVKPCSYVCPELEHRDKQAGGGREGG